MSVPGIGDVTAELATAGSRGWCATGGSVYLADQKLPIQVPRVRDRAAAACRTSWAASSLSTPR
jgi:hypothetical protein